MKRLRYIAAALCLMVPVMVIVKPDEQPKKKREWSMIVKDFLLIYFVFRGVVKEAYTLALRARYPQRSPSFTFEDDDDGGVMRPSIVTISSGFKRMIFCQTLTTAIGVVAVALLHFHDELPFVRTKDTSNTDKESNEQNSTTHCY